MTATFGVTSGTLTAASGGGVTVSGSRTATLTLSGTLANLNTYLAGVSRPTYVPVANANGTVTLTLTTDDGGNTGTGGAQTDVDTSTITIAAVNDAPVNTLPSTYSTNEDTSLGLTGISLSDVDAASGTVTATFGVTSGTLTATSGGGVTVSGSGTATLTLSGTLANLNTYLAGVSRPAYVPVADFNGTVTLTLTTNDGGNTGSGGAKTDVDTSTITVTAVADIVDDSATTNEDTAVTISVLSNDTFEDAGRTITAVNGAAITAGGAGVSVTGGTVTLNMSGQLIYTPSANYNGTPSFTYTVTAGGVTESATVNVTVGAVNDAPVNTLPSSYSTNEDTSVGLTGISLSDTDAASGTLTATLGVTSGTLTAASGGGVTVSGSGTATLTLTGTLANLNSYLAGVSRPAYVPIADFNGAVTLTLTTDDGGNTGSGGAKTDVDTSTITVAAVTDIVDDSATTNEDNAVTISVLSNDTFSDPGRTVTAVNGAAITAGGGGVSVTGGTVTLNMSGQLIFTPSANYNGTPSFTYTVTAGGVTETATVNVTVDAVNDAPVNTLPSTYSTNEDTSLALAGISLSDVDVGSGTVTATFGVTSGTLTATSGGGVTVSGSGTAALTLSGTLANVNAYLAGASRPSYVPIADFNGAVTLTLTTSDGGNTGSGGTKTDVDTSTITVVAVADIVNDSATTNEDNAVTISVLSNDTFEDAGRTVTAVNGAAITAGGAGVSVTGGVVTLNMSGQLVYTPSANYTGTPSFTYTVTAGGVMETGTVNVTVGAVNDAPVNTLPSTYSTNEDTSVGLTGISLSDVDAGSGTLTATFGVTSGTLTATSGGGVTVSGSGTAALTLSGTLANLNTYLAGVSRPAYVPVANASGTVTLTLTTSDGGNTGSGGTLTDVDTSTITVVAVNDAPVAADDFYSTGQGVPVALDVLTNDQDIEHDVLTIVSIDGTPIAVSGSVAVTGGLVTLNANQTLTFTPTPGFTGDATFAYGISDGNGGSDVANATISVLPGVPPLLDLDGNDSYPTPSAANSVGVTGGYNHSTGSISWSSDWVEGGDDASATGGSVKIVTDGGREVLEVSGSNKSIERTVDLSGNSYGILSFEYRRVGLSGSSDFVTVEVSADGVTFTEIGSFRGPADDGSYATFNADISGFISSTTTIRLSTAPTFTNAEAVRIDSVSVTVSNPLTGYQGDFTENGSAVPIGATTGAGVLLVSDGSVTDLDQVSVRIVGSELGDVLSIQGALPGGITASSYDSVTGTLTLSGVASLSNYQTAIAQVRFGNSGDDFAAGTRAIEVTPRDSSSHWPDSDCIHNASPG